MSEGTTITVRWIEAYTDETWSVASDVQVIRGREQITVSRDRLKEGTLALARELASPREQRRLRQSTERFEARPGPFGLERWVYREYLIFSVA